MGLLKRIIDKFRKKEPEKVFPTPTGITRPDAIERRLVPTARITGMSPVLSEESVAHFEPDHREQFERIFGPACIRNGYKHTVHMQNDLLNLVLQPGESRVIPEVLKHSYHPISRHNMIKEWDPRKTLRDLVAEYERSMHPDKYYDSTTEELCEKSEIKVWLLRGQKTTSEPFRGHRPVTDDSRPLIEQDVQKWDRELAGQGMGSSSEFPGFGGGQFGGGGAGGEWTPDPPQNMQEPIANMQGNLASTQDAPEIMQDGVSADVPSPDPSPDPPSGDQNA